MQNRHEGSHMNRLLEKAVVAAFCEDEVTCVRRRFASFDERDWLRARKWLHTSGLALYFLARARALGILDVIPERILRELERSLAENRARTEYLFNEFVKINMEFQRAQLSYANLKGFTLVPRSCFDPVYRYQHDLDFLVSRRDAVQCRLTLERHGYRLSATNGDSLEFLIGAAEPSTLRDLYKVRSQRSLEVHIVPEPGQSKPHTLDDLLSRLQLQVCNGFEFPALSECDKFLAQGLHVFKHLKSEWTRAAWILEFANTIRWYQEDQSYWREVVAFLSAAPEAKLGIGVASLMASRGFGAAPPAGFLSCTVNELPEQVRSWFDRYGEDLAFAEFPGTKLYLLLEDVLSGDSGGWRKERRRRLFPAHLPPTTTLHGQGSNVRLRVALAWMWFRFVWMRLRFHVTEGLRYKVEAARWKKLVADLQG